MVLSGFGCLSGFWASLVVAALMGMSGKRKIFCCHWFLFFCQFLGLFCDCTSCPLLFLRGARHLQYLWNNFPYFPQESPQSGAQPGSLPKIFPTLRTFHYFSHIPFISFQKAIVGHSGNEWEMFGFHLFFDHSCQFLD